MLRRASAVAVSVSTLVLAGSGTALADIWGGVDCGTTDYAGCDLGAGQGGQPGQRPAPPQSGDSGQDDGSSGSGEGSDRPRGDQIVGDANLANCRYVRSDYQPPSQGTTTVAYRPPNGGGAIAVTPAAYRLSSSTTEVRFAQRQQPSPGQSGAWYVYQCSGPGFADAL